MYKVILNDGREVECDKIEGHPGFVQTYVKKPAPENAKPLHHRVRLAYLIQQTFTQSQIKSITPKEK